MGPVIRIPTLKEIASVNVAIALWNHINILYMAWRKNRIDGLNFVPSNEVLLLTNALLVPKSVAKGIKIHVNKLSDELDKWVTYHCDFVLNVQRKKEYLYCLINHFVWYPDGTIDAKQTARNLINSNRLSNVEKYQIMCTYCLGDEIKQISTVLKADNAIDHVDCEYDPLIYYWNHYCRNELDQIPRHGSLDDFMFRHVNVDNWPAKEYFFDRLSAEERISSAIFLIEKYGIQFQKNVLMKLNESELLQVYMDKAVMILANYSKSQVHSDDLLSTWYDIRHLITPDQFSFIFNELLKTSAIAGDSLTEIWNSACGECRRNALHYNNHELIRKTLHSWRTTNDSNFLCTVLQNLSANVKREITTETFFTEFCKSLIHHDKLSMLANLFNVWSSNGDELVQFKRDFAQSEFFGNHCKYNIMKKNLLTLERSLEICLPKGELFKLRLASSTMKDFFSNYCEKLITSNEIPTLERLMKICSSHIDADEFAQFKQDLMKKKLFDVCHDSFMSSGDVQILEELLNACLFSTEESIRFKQDLLMSSDGINKCADYFNSGIDKLCEIIAHCFPDADSAVEFKNMIMFSSPVIAKLQNLILDGKALNDVKNHIDNFLTSFEDKRSLKNRLINNLQHKMVEIFLKYDVTGWQYLLKWCLDDDEEAIEEFKYKLPIDEIFEGRLKECIFQWYDEYHRASRCSLKRDFDFASMDRFLNWYFESPRMIKDYKLRKINAYESIETIQTLLKKNCHSSYMRALMDWFFENDAVEIAKFKKKHKGEKIVNMVKIVRESYFNKKRHSI